MKRTSKADWFTKYLSVRDFWVGGTTVNVDGLSNSVAIQTTRFFQGRTSRFLIVYILEFMEHYDINSDYEEIIANYQNNFPLSPNFTLAIWPSEEPKFATLEANNYQSNMNTENVLKTFAKYDHTIVGQANYLKPLNKSYTDFFHLWGRKHLNGFQNDIDTFIFTEQNFHVFELKRPKEQIKTWKPYKADKANYEKLSEFCNSFGYQLTNIAYTENMPGKLKIFKEVNFDGNFLNYLTTYLNINPNDDILNRITNLEFHSEVSLR